jgi:hypothetical protein
MKGKNPESEPQTSQCSAAVLTFYDPLAIWGKYSAVKARFCRVMKAEKSHFENETTATRLGKHP